MEALLIFRVDIVVQCQLEYIIKTLRVWKCFDIYASRLPVHSMWKSNWDETYEYLILNDSVLLSLEVLNLHKQFWDITFFSFFPHKMNGS
jgi:hypothetical protein